MKRFLCVIFALALCFVIAESLTCKKCALSIFGSCLIPSNDPCAANQSCSTNTAVFASVKLVTTGCMDSGLCSQNSTGSILGFDYSVTRTCCVTDQCNGASSAQLSLAVAAAATLVASSWGAWGY